MEQIIHFLQSIDKTISLPFWREYDFWLGIINAIVLIVTLSLLSKYTRETEETRNQITKQTNLEQMPIMLLYIRNLADSKVPFGELEELKRKRQNYLVNVLADGTPSSYYISLRNTGKGTAFNVEVESNVFDIIDYETRFFAPQKDEHSIRIQQKGNKKIETWEKFENSIFTIKCKDLAGNNYEFRYKIIDFKNKVIIHLDPLESAYSL